MPPLGQFQSFLHLLQFALSANEAGQPTSGRYLETGAQRSHSQHFIETDRLTDPLNLCFPKGAKLKIPFSQLLGVLAHQDRTRGGQALHPGC